MLCRRFASNALQRILAGNITIVHRHGVADALQANGVLGRKTIALHIAVNDRKLTAAALRAGCLFKCSDTAAILCNAAHCGNAYQIRSLEKELGVSLFLRSTTQVSMTDAGRALLPYAEQLNQHTLAARTGMKRFARQKQLVLRLAPVLLQRDPIYPVMMERLHEALPAYEWEVDTRTPPSDLYQMLCTDADACIRMPTDVLQPEVLYTPIMRSDIYMLVAPEHPLAGKSRVQLADLAGQKIYYEPIYQGIVGFVQAQFPALYARPEYIPEESYESVYAELLAGHGMFLCAVRYPGFPECWHLPLELPQMPPDTCLLTLRDDPRPEIVVLRRVIEQVYREFGYL